MYCEKCQVEFPEGLRYCKWCGGPLSSRPAATEGMFACPDCKSAVESSWAFCKTCGKKLDFASIAAHTPCASCGGPLDTAGPVCSRCAAAQASATHGSSQFCPNCGEAIPAGGAFCKKCGRSVTKAGVGIPEPELVLTRTCNVCGAENSAGATVCRVCMRPLSGTLHNPRLDTGSRPGDAASMATLVDTPAFSFHREDDTSAENRATMIRERHTAAMDATRPSEKLGSVEDDRSTALIESEFAEQVTASNPQDEIPTMFVAVPDLKPPDPSVDSQAESKFEPQAEPPAEVRHSESVAEPTPPPSREKKAGKSSVTEIYGTSLQAENAEHAGPGPVGVTAEFVPPVDIEPPVSPAGPSTGPTFAPVPPTGPVPTGPVSGAPVNSGPIPTPPVPGSPVYSEPIYQQPVPSGAPPQMAYPGQHAPGVPYQQGPPLAAQPKKGGAGKLIAVAVVIVGLLILGVAAVVVWRLKTAKQSQTQVAEQPTPLPQPSVAATPSPSPSAPALPEGMVLVPAGSYDIGRDGGDKYSSPPHKVDLPAFYIDATEVTNAQYKKFLDATGHAPPELWKGPDFPQGKGDYPVVGVTWQDATDYAAWAGKRLPSETEWEAAARGSAGLRYPWGNDWKPDLASLGAGTQPVGAHKGGASPCGALDMIGNVWEWTADEFTLYPGSSAELPEKKDPAVTYRVIRGGAFDAIESNDATYRGFVDQSKGYEKTGFRCVKDSGSN